MNPENNLESPNQETWYSQTEYDRATARFEAKVSPFADLVQSTSDILFGENPEPEQTEAFTQHLLETSIRIEQEVATDIGGKEGVTKDNAELVVADFERRVSDTIQERIDAEPENIPEINELTNWAIRASDVFNEQNEAEPLVQFIRNTLENATATANASLVDLKNIVGGNSNNNKNRNGNRNRWTNKEKYAVQAALVLITTLLPILIHLYGQPKAPIIETGPLVTLEAPQPEVLQPFLTPEEKLVETLQIERGFIHEINQRKIDAGVNPFEARLYSLDLSALIQGEYLKTANILLSHATDYHYLNQKFPTEVAILGFDPAYSIHVFQRLQLASLLETGSAEFHYADHGGASEVIAKTSGGVQELVNLLFSSIRHRDALLNPDYKHIGVFVIKAENGQNILVAVLGQGLDGRDWRESERATAGLQENLFLPLVQKDSPHSIMPGSRPTPTSFQLQDNRPLKKRPSHAPPKPNEPTRNTGKQGSQFYSKRRQHIDQLTQATTRQIHTKTRETTSKRY